MKTMTKKTNDDPAWDMRIGLTLAGCLVIAGMPLAAEAVAEVQPKTTADLMNDPERVPASASCRVCQLANVYGCPSCHDEHCPNPLPDDSEATEQKPANTVPIRDAFHVTDEKSANWYLRKLATLDNEKARILAQTEKMIAELDSDRDGLKFLYEGELQEFVRQELARKGGRKKTLNLLQGTCAFRSVPASVKVADPNAALEYARANNLPCIETTERVNAEAYKKLAAGKMLPGMDTTPERENFTVTFGTK